MAVPPDAAARIHTKYVWMLCHRLATRMVCRARRLSYSARPNIYYQLTFLRTFRTTIGGFLFRQRERPCREAVEVFRPPGWIYAAPLL